MSSEGESSETVGMNYFYCLTLISVPLQNASEGCSDGFAGCCVVSDPPGKAQTPWIETLEGVSTMDKSPCTPLSHI